MMLLIAFVAVVAVAYADPGSFRGKEDYSGNSTLKMCGYEATCR